MKKALLILTAIILAACIPPRPVKPVEARNSIYKIYVNEHVDLTSIGGEADTELGSMGTAWVAAQEGGRSYLMTAGHVCESDGKYQYEEVNIFTGEVLKLEFPVSKVEYSIEALDGTRTKIETLLVDDDRLDLCLLSYQGDLGRPLPIASRDPEYGDHAVAIGAPAGIWGGGVAVISDLTFSGRGQLWRVPEGMDQVDSLAFTGLVTGGSSGSPIMKDGYVVALLNLASVRFVKATTGVPHESLAAFIRRALHKEP